MAVARNVGQRVGGAAGEKQFSHPEGGGAAEALKEPRTLCRATWTTTEDELLDSAGRRHTETLGGLAGWEAHRQLASRQTGCCLQSSFFSPFGSSLRPLAHTQNPSSAAIPSHESRQSGVGAGGGVGEGVPSQKSQSAALETSDSCPHT